MERNIERQRTDEDFAWAAVFALEWDTAVPHHQITVMAEDGWLTLEGEVDTPQHKSSAEIAVSRLTGVVGVRNLITVKPITRSQAWESIGLILRGLSNSQHGAVHRWVGTR